MVPKHVPLNATPRLRLQKGTALNRAHRHPILRRRVPNEPPIGIKDHQIRVLIHTRHGRASTRRRRVEQGLATVVGDEVAVALEDHLARSVAVRGRVCGVPDEAEGIGVSEDDDVAVAVEGHVDAVVKLAEMSGGGQLEGSGGPGLSVRRPCCGGEW